MGKDDASLQNVAIFLLNCTRARKYLIPYPSNEVPWGPTQTFYDYNMKLVNQNGPVIVSWGGKRKLQIDLNEAMLITHQVLDADGQEIDTTGGFRVSLPTSRFYVVNEIAGVGKCVCILPESSVILTRE